MFIDRVKITVTSGKGGDGVISFRREKFVAKGGPDGGDGGRGGHIVFRVDNNLSTLLDFRYKHHIRAGNGGHGSGQKKTGKYGTDEIVRVPPGTIVFDKESGEQLGDLTENGQELNIAKGGRGGIGNVHFATSTRQAPRKAKQGKPGEERVLILELKLIADVGLVGLPNAGKSTLLSRVSAARPEVADYPFTTLTPHLGMIQPEGWDGFVMADIPGLIEGASEGKGLGHRFLRHIERTRTLAILIETIDPDPEKTLNTLLNELEAFNPSLVTRPRIIVRTKTDLGGDSWDGVDISISSVTGEGVDELLQKLKKMIDTAKVNDNIE
ncbi:MAG: GTPase ObgE [Candidatus Electryonea clarkiae]|nr:GTPase ObgE [Candidatus Electryonea clarkiae]MDP8287573.1 GTPase ObgE [Candidatus Electryonea clarkiae]